MIGCFYCGKEKKKYKSYKKEKTNIFICLCQSTRNTGKKRSRWRIGCSSFRFTALSNKNIDKHDEDRRTKIIVIIKMNRTGMIQKVLCL